MAAERFIRAGAAQARAKAAAPAPAPAPRPPVRSSRGNARGSAHLSSNAKDRHGVYHDESQEIPLEEITYPLDRPCARVRVEAGLTINLGDFNMLRLSCTVELPCPPERLDEAYEKASQFAADRVNEEELKWLGPKKG